MYCKIAEGINPFIAFFAVDHRFINWYTKDNLAAPYSGIMGQPITYFRLIFPSACWCQGLNSPHDPLILCSGQHDSMIQPDEKSPGHAREKDSLDSKISLLRIGRFLIGKLTA